MNLKEKISKQISAGYSDSEINSNLLADGYSQEEINKELKSTADEINRKN